MTLAHCKNERKSRKQLRAVREPVTKVASACRRAQKNLEKIFFGIHLTRVMNAFRKEGWYFNTHLLFLGRTAMKVFGLAALAIFLLFGGNVRGDEPMDQELEKLFNRKFSQLIKPRDYDAETRLKAALTLDKAARMISNMVNCLATALKEGDEALRIQSARTLGEIGPSAKRALPTLTAALGDDSPKVRAAAAFAIGLIEQHYPIIDKDYRDGTMPALIKALKDKEISVRQKATTAFRLMGPKAKEAVPALVEVLREESAGRGVEHVRLRQYAALALGAIGPGASSAVPAMLEVVQGDDNREVQNAVLIPLGRIRSREELVVPTLLKVLKDNKRPELRGNAAIRSRAKISYRILPVRG